MINRINEFLKNKTKKPKIIVIYWPTASWKTSFSIEVAKNFNWEIISTDSRQIFKYLDIWTWKITETEKEWIIHHMIDIIKPDINYSVWEFKNNSEKIIEEIYLKWKIPILCWWTWLYIDSLIYDFNIPKIPADEKIRSKLEKEVLEFWNEYVYNKLMEIDPLYALELHPNNIRYIIRAIEVKLLTWKSKRDFREEKTLKYDTLFLTPYTGDREKLYSNIDKRVSMMFENWLIQEVKKLLEKWYKKEDFWMKTIWYKEVIDYLTSFQTSTSRGEEVEQKKITFEETLALVQKHNRNYAKRQLTWFRKYEK